MNFIYLRQNFLQKATFIQLLILIATADVSAQIKHTLKGNLIDSKNKTSVAYANIKLQKANISSMSNSEGLFAFNYNSSTEIDTLIITCVGYNSIKMPLQLFTDRDFKDLILVPNTIVLNEVVINNLNPEFILKESVTISANRYPSPAIFKGYYRESVKRDSFLTKYADGLVEYYVERKKDKALKTELRVLQSRAKELPIQEEEEKINEFNSLISINKIIKFISLTEISPLDSNRFQFYDYTISEFSEANKEIYRIDFEPKSNNNKVVLGGKIFIDKETKLILAIDCKVAAGSEKNLKSFNFLGTKISAISAGIYIRFESNDESYGIKYIKESHGILFSGKKLNQKNEFTSELLITDLQTNNCSPFTNGTYNKRSLYSRGNQYTFNYWDNPKLIPNVSQESTFLEKWQGK
ncbi:carboxypeptidase-like regulatory domain-containing protein [Daejeonella sp.]|uniref:carboxypeptidase-like regulatory domain-containing protein n=1 Tax=Daejeonella sp. TaxID=2805397 RepID=UPI0025BA6BBA|nr:carboxypeptidase-like regulatory domain-containing protein [Daejeonella sp.]